MIIGIDLTQLLTAWCLLSVKCLNTFFNKSDRMASNMAAGIVAQTNDIT